MSYGLFDGYDYEIFFRLYCKHILLIVCYVYLSIATLHSVDAIDIKIT
jgi:hypothetical protein